MKLDKIKIPVFRFFMHNPFVRAGLLLLAAGVFNLLLYPDLMVSFQPYELGDIADKDIKAEKDFFVENQKATELRRQQAEEEVLTVYDFNTGLINDLKKRVHDAFAQMRELNAAEKEKFQQTQSVEGVDGKKPNGVSALTIENAELLQRLRGLKPVFEEKIGISLNTGAFELLVQNAFSTKIADAVIRILHLLLEKGVVSNRELLLRETERGVILRDLETQTDRVEKKLKGFLGLDQAKNSARLVGKDVLDGFDYGASNLVVDLVQGLIQPNITLNRNETEERKKAVAAEIKPSLYKIKAGEMLLREGERINQEQLVKLKTMEAQLGGGRQWIRGLGATFLLICSLLVWYRLHMVPSGASESGHNKSLFFFTTVFIIFLFVPKAALSIFESLQHNAFFSGNPSTLYFGIPLAAGAMTVCLFFNIKTAVAFATVLSISVALLINSRFEVFLYFIISSTMGAWWIGDCRERRVFIMAGLKTGLLNVVVASAILLFTVQDFRIYILWDLLYALLGGIGAGIITAGFAPFFEMAFGYVTDITLLELANLDRPILRRLMLEAPGTYHHSVIVGSLVEAAASEIRANPLLAKVCGYYHDIGKIKKPLYFVENQARGKNRHDKLAPSMSSLILIAHIKDGVEIAKENKLKPVIIDAIRQHHGTSLIRYFYEKARLLKGDSVNIDDFRYPGPRPQSRETALVMLADVVEAASRTLENPTPARIQGLVQNLINKVFSDGQLDYCELTLKDLHSIAKSFNKILNGIHHHRIEYPDAASSTEGKTKNGSADRQSTKPASDSKASSKSESPGHLKRLGLS